MWKLVIKLIWNALPVVALVLIGAWLYNQVTGTFTSPTQSTPVVSVVDRRGVVEAIKSVNKQIFIEHYNMVDVEYTEIPSDWTSALGLKQEFIVLVRGRVPAGFDLHQLSEDDIWISNNGQRIQLTLPPPTIFVDNVSIDLENSRILAQSDTCPNFLCQDDLTAYQANVLPAARELLIDYAHENGILYQAAGDGQAYYEQFLRSLGFDEVRVIITEYQE